MLEVSKSSDICQGELHVGNDTSSKERSVLQLAKLEGKSHQRLLALDTELQDWVRVCPAGFWSCVGPAFSHYAPIPPFKNGNIYSVVFYVGSM